jgi:hypothetical protein
MQRTLAFVLVTLSLTACKGSTPPDAKAAADAADSSGFSFTSPAFANGDAIPAKFTCDAEGGSPELDWKGAPPATKSFALIVDDPDAPAGLWTHWVLFDLPATTTKLAEGAKGLGLDGKNSWDATGWGGPCPPSGTHHYNFRLFALDVATLGKSAGASRADVEAAMSAHVVGRATLMGTYARAKK